MNTTRFPRQDLTERADHSTNPRPHLMSLDGVIEPIEAWDFDYIDDELRDLSPSSSSPPIHVLSSGSLYETNFPLRVPDGASLEGDGKWSTPPVSTTSSRWAPRRSSPSFRPSRAIS
jgi:hypothetical protein